MPWGVANYNTNPALNVSINGVDIAELAAAAGYNDALRQIMADIATWTSANGVTYPITIAQGGSGQTTAAAALAALGGLPILYRDLPIVVKSAAFTFADAERSNGIYYNGAAAAATINPYATTPITQGAIYILLNQGAGVLTVTRGAGVTLLKNGSAVSSNAAIAVGGQATLISWQGSGDTWTISGPGVS